MIRSTEISPKVPEESQQIMTVPSFFNKSPYQAQSPTPQQNNPFLPSPPLSRIDSVPEENVEENSEKNTCKCFHVLVCDDDPFQKYYYQTLFQKSLDFLNTSVDKKDFKYLILNSGEELLEQFEKIKDCPVQLLTLVIVDFYMGDKHIDGIETVHQLRSQGYKGKAILRTGTSLEDVRKSHPEIEEMLDSKELECILDKANHSKAKEVIESQLRKIENKDEDGLQKEEESKEVDSDGGKGEEN